MPPLATLGVDFGTSHTVAVVRQPGGGPVLPLLFDGSPLLSSAVYAEEPGRLIVGRDAVHSARLRPERYEPNPKRRVDDGAVLLGDSEFEIPQLFAAVLERVRVEAERVMGGPPARTVVTHPAVWGPARRLVLIDACEQAGLGDVTLMPEPVAAAHYFARQPGAGSTGGTAMVVYDFGGGTFDASVVATTATGFEVLAVDGSDSLGGVDIDHALVDHIGHQFADDPRWTQLLHPTEVSGRRHRRTFLDDVRAAKERLSRHNRVDLLVPILDVDTQVTREELEAITEPLLGKAVRLTQAVMRTAAVPTDRVTGVFLVGGASRMPLVATSLHRGTGIAPTIIDQPELVVATGATVEPEPVTPDPTAPVTPPTPVSPAPISAVPSPAPMSTMGEHTMALHSPVTTQWTPPSIPSQPQAAPVSASQSPMTSRPIRGLIPLYWVQFGMGAVQCLVTLMILIAIPPPEEYLAIAVAFMIVAATFTVVVAVDAVRLVREPGRLRRSVLITQGIVLGATVIAAAILVILGVPYIPVLRATVIAPGAIAAVILGLVRLGRPPQPITRTRIMRDLSGTLTVQLSLMMATLLVACAWWTAFLSSAGDPVNDDYIGALLVAGLLVPVIIFTLVVGVVHLSRLRVMTASGRLFLQACQVMWVVIGALYALPWFYSRSHRLMPAEVTAVDGGWLMSRDWQWGVGDLFNELGLWTLVFSAIAALLVLIQLKRLATTGDAVNV